MFAKLIALTFPPQILADSQASIHPLIVSTIDKIRFSLGYVDARQLSKRLDKIVLETLPRDETIRRSGKYNRQGEDLARGLFVTWVRARNDQMSRWDIAALVKKDILPLVSRRAETYDAFRHWES